MESELSVRDVLTKSYVGVSESDSVLGAVELMREELAGSVLVVRGQETVGIMTEWDVLGVVASRDDPATVEIGEVMSSPVISIRPDRSLTDAADIMARDNIRNLVVEDEDGTVGILTQRDVIAAAGSFPGTTTTTDREGLSVAAAESMESEQHRSNGGSEYSSQSICEACGSLADSLFESNGQLLCADCRSV